MIIVRLDLNKRWGDASAWCGNQFGKELRYEAGGRWSYICKGQFSFCNAEDAIMFKLKWS